MKNCHKKIFFSFVFLFLFSFSNVLAQNINLRIEGPDITILDAKISLPQSCEILDSSGNLFTFPGNRAICALKIAKDQGLIEEFSVTNWGFAFSLDSINSISNLANWSQLWIIRKNFALSDLGIDGLELSENDELLLSFGPWPMEPLKIDISTSTLFLGASFALKVSVFNDDKKEWEQFPFATIFHLNGESFLSENGTFQFVPQATGTILAWVESPNKTRSPKINFQVLAPIEKVYFFIRYQDKILFEGEREIKDGEILISPIPTSTSSEAFARNSKSVLAELLNIDKISESFEISQLEYFPSFDAFYLKCLKILPENTFACDNWQYVVNDIYPSLGLDKFLLSDGDKVFIYFGPNHRLLLTTSTVFVKEPILLIAQNYNYQNNTWEPLNGMTVGVIKFSPEDPFSPLEIATSSLSDGGTTTFSLSWPGDYQIGLKEDFYFPALSISVLEKPSLSVGLGSVFAHKNIDVFKAISFLSQNQKPDGSFGNFYFLTDWVAIAFGAVDFDFEAKQKLKNYLLTDPNPGNLLTDFERRAMALMALNINPYSGTKTNYIQKILDFFDGEQFGNPNLFNDDVFAIIVLLKAGFSSLDPILQKTVSFVLKFQDDSGSFQGIDMTSATISALNQLSHLPEVSPAILKAKNYLKNSQKGDGGWGNVFSTSWAMLAIFALGENENQWIKNEKTPGDFLFSQQGLDGGLLESDFLDNRLWATALSVPAGLEKPWDKILFSFSPPNLPPQEETAFIQEKFSPSTFVFQEAKIFKKGKASVFIERENVVKIDGQGNWDGNFEILAPTDFEQMKDFVGTSTIFNLALEPIGFLEILGGENLTFEFQKPIKISIPVFAPDGTLGLVYAKKSQNEEFKLETECIIFEQICQIQTNHLTKFLVVKKETKFTELKVAPEPKVTKEIKLIKEKKEPKREEIKTSPEKSKVFIKEPQSASLITPFSFFFSGLLLKIFFFLAILLFLFYYLKFSVK